MFFYVKAGVTVKSSSYPVLHSVETGLSLQMAATTLFVNQLPYSASQRDVATFFAKAAGVSADELMPSVRMVLKDGQFKGTAFVDMRDWAAADAGIALHQAKLKCADGSPPRRINVREAMSKAQLDKLGETGKSRAKTTVHKAHTGTTKAAKEDEDEDEGDTGGDVTGALGKDRRGRMIVGELDPQRKRKHMESEYLKTRRSLQDMECTCQDCHAPFIFSVFEQEFFLAKEWPIPRQRCKACSTAKKAKPRGEKRDGEKGDGVKLSSEKVLSEKAASTPPPGRRSSGGDGGGGGGASAGRPLFRCHSCGQEGHARANCPKLGRELARDKAGDGGAGGGVKGGAKERSAADVTCFICGQKGHFAKACGLKTNDQEVGLAMKAAAKAAGKKRKADEGCGVDSVGQASSPATKKSGFHRGRKEAKHR